MKYFKLIGNQAYWTLYFKNKELAKNYVNKINGQVLLGNWDKCEMEIRFRGEKANLEPDIMDFGGTSGVVINTKVYNELQEMIKLYVEFLPVKLEETLYYILNPTTILDCINYELSIKDNKNPFLINKITKYVFKKNIKYPSMFRMKNEERAIIINEKLAEALEKNNFIGYSLKEVWDSEG